MQGSNNLCYKEDLSYRYLATDCQILAISITQSVPMQKDGESCGLCVIMVSGCVISTIIAN